MGYQVGNQCIADKVQAENHYFSLIVPTVGQDGRLHHPTYSNGQWKLNGQVLQISLPECDPAQNFRDGAELGWYLFGIMAAVYVFGIIKKQIR